MAGSLIISLDFELHWGGAEKWNLIEKKEYFDNTRKVIPEILSLFKLYKIKATWATVGFLFASSEEELQIFLPEVRPSYSNTALNYYRLIDNDTVRSKSEQDDPYHFAQSLIKKILATEGQELASHTFSHYYCNEEGQTARQFDYDLKATQDISIQLLNKKLSSLVFPRNQYRKEYLNTIADNNYKVVRTNPDVWFWKRNNKVIPLARALDTLFPISSRLSFKNKEIVRINNIVLLPASRFFRPYSNRERIVQRLKMNRIKSEMTRAAKRYENYHLWWHPHNFGSFPNENLIQLQEILEHYKKLNKIFGFSSKAMQDYSNF